MPDTATQAQIYRFWVERGRSRIGTHTVTVVSEGAALRATIAIDLAIRFGPITVYRYRHESTELWQDNRLLRLDAKTNANGTHQAVKARHGPDGLCVGSESGEHVLAANSLPSSFWHPETPGRRPLFDTQSGRRLRIQWTETKPGRWRVTGDLALDLDYAQDGRWSGLRFRLGGADFTYRAC